MGGQSQKSGRHWDWPFPAFLQIGLKTCIWLPWFSPLPAGGAPPNVDPEAYSWFQSVDSDHSGYISIKELKQALVNSNWSSFNDETCLMMISEY